MPKLYLLRDDSGDNEWYNTTYTEYCFNCPGCECWHQVRIKGPGPNWKWNGDLDKPTFTPSILVNQGSTNPTTPQCHSFVTDGMIQFLPDCTHAMKGQTVEIPDWKI